MTDLHATAIAPPVAPLEPLEGSGSRFALWIGLAMLLTVALHGVLWATGFASRELTLAVDAGAAKVERRGVGEMGDDVIRKAIQIQRSTLPFWTTLLGLAEFLIEPISLAIRALVVATIFSALAALTGRPIRFNRALDESALIQLVWVAGLATQVALMVALRRPEVETSAALLLGPGRHEATTLVMLRQLDLFALLGWFLLARAAWLRGQANLLAALTVCLGLATGEGLIRAACSLMIGGGMRLSILPDTPG